MMWMYLLKPIVFPLVGVFVQRVYVFHFKVDVLDLQDVDERTSVGVEVVAIDGDLLTTFDASAKIEIAHLF